MRLEHFQYIVEIARCKSMSKASKKLFITQPSLSTAIQSLETELGFPIFKRSAAGVALTEKGEALTAVVASLLTETDEAKVEAEKAAIHGKPVTPPKKPASPEIEESGVRKGRTYDF